MSELIGILIGLGASIHITCMFYNVGTLFAYFQRTRIEECEEFTKAHIIAAILYGWPGILALPGVLIATERGRFGIKFWRGEFQVDENPWYVHYREALARIQGNESKSAKQFNRPEGKCVDLWEE
jgi:hypothetical protein